MSTDPGTPSPDTDRPGPAAPTGDPSGTDTSAKGTEGAPGVSESIGRVRVSARGLVQAHMDLLKAELAVTGRDLGIIVALVLGALVGAILGSVTFDTKGALAIALTIGYVVAIVTSLLIAMRRGFDPERRYERLVPRESIAMAEETKRYLERQWRRQRRKVAGR